MTSEKSEVDNKESVPSAEVAWTRPSTLEEWKKPGATASETFEVDNKEAVVLAQAAWARPSPIEEREKTEPAANVTSEVDNKDSVASAQAAWARPSPIEEGEKTEPAATETSEVDNKESVQSAPAAWTRSSTIEGRNKPEPTASETSGVDNKESVPSAPAAWTRPSPMEEREKTEPAATVTSEVGNKDSVPTGAAAWTRPSPIEEGEKTEPAATETSEMDNKESVASAPGAWARPSPIEEMKKSNTPEIRYDGFVVGVNDRQHLTEFQDLKAKYFFEVNLDVKDKKVITWADVESYLLLHMIVAKQDGNRDLERKLSYQTRHIWEFIQDSRPNKDRDPNILTLDQVRDTWGALSEYIVKTNTLPGMFEDWIKLGFDLYGLDEKEEVPLDSFQNLYNKMNLDLQDAIVAYRFLTENSTKPLDFERVLSIIKALITSSDDEHYSQFILPGFVRQVMNKRVQDDNKSSNLRGNRDLSSNKNGDQQEKSVSDEDRKHRDQRREQPTSKEDHFARLENYVPGFQLSLGDDDDHIKQILRDLNWECDEVEILDGNVRRNLVLHDHPNQQDKYQQELKQFEALMTDHNDYENQQQQASDAQQQPVSSSSERKLSGRAQPFSSQHPPIEEQTRSPLTNYQNQSRILQQNVKQQQPLTLKLSTQTELSREPQLQKQYQGVEPTRPLFQQNQRPGIRHESDNRQSQPSKEPQPQSQKSAQDDQNKSTTYPKQSSYNEQNYPVENNNTSKKPPTSTSDGKSFPLKQTDFPLNKFSREDEEECVASVLRQIMPQVERLVEDEVKKAAKNPDSGGDNYLEEVLGHDPFQFMFGGGSMFTPNRTYGGPQQTIHPNFGGVSMDNRSNEQMKNSETGGLYISQNPMFMTGEPRMERPANDQGEHLA
ncbi:unnamed protein product [Didymodactylos carnosus]|uniref:Uncharacterized protein n=1 Tax=Didymodactylos carnosus TaxID=1234261 RepID=A0A8S2EDE8_9BILA|nr:unnamed protein product [Didymodactylos carnosus]CAF3962922.1 unnamed protein product [Didymodactylos carnosus]